MKPPRLLVAVTAAVLGPALAASILTIWIETRWIGAVYQPAILTLALAWSVFAVLRPLRLAASPIAILLAGAASLGAAQLAAGITVSRWETEVEILRWAVCLAAFLLAQQIGAEPSIRTHFLRGLLLFGFAFSAIAAVQYLNEPGKPFGVFDAPYPAEFLGPFSNRDHYASFIQLLLPIALYEALAARPKLLASPVMATVAAAMLFASVIEGASRAGSFLVFAETVVVLLAAARRRWSGARTGLRAVAALLVCMAALTIAIGWTRLWERAQEADPYLTRRQILESSFAMIRVRPLLGVGLGNFENAYPAYASYDNGEILGHAHNDWVEWTVEGGAPLTLIMIAVLAMSAPALWRSLWGVGVLSVFAHCLVDFPLHRPAIALWLFAMMGVACGADTATRHAAKPLRRQTGAAYHLPVGPSL